MEHIAHIMEYLRHRRILQNRKDAIAVSKNVSPYAGRRISEVE